MNIQMIKSLFTLFSGVEDSEEPLPLLMSSIDETMKYVHPDANSEDIYVYVIWLHLLQVCSIGTLQQKQFQI